MQTAAQAKQEEDMPRLQHLKQIEAAMVQKFKDADIVNQDAPEDHHTMEFEEKNSGKHMCTFPFPYMNGYLHLGHAFTISKCEFQSRYQRQMGKRTLFPFAFHCTGMPIQAAANRLKREITNGKTCSSQPSDVELKALIKANPKYEKPELTQYEILTQLGFTEEKIPEFQDPQHWIEFFPPQGQQDLQDFGLFTDWRRSFITTQANPYFNSFVRWQFTTLKEKGKVKHGKRYTIFSELDNQPCADHDRAKGEGVAPQEYTGIKIELLDKPEVFAQWADKKIFLVAATLRPETMYGQTNCFILPEGNYGLYAMKNDEFFVMSHRAAKNFAFQEMTLEDTKYPCLASVVGQDIIGKRLKSPLAPFEFVYALPMPTILMNKGTGIVTSVPSDSPDDYAMLYDLQTKKGLREKYNVLEEHCVPFEPVPIIEIPGLGNMAAKSEYERLKIQSHKDSAKLKEAKDVCYQQGFTNGVMIIGEAKGQLVQDAKDVIKKMLIAQGLACTYYEPESEVISRSDDNCCVALKFQWLLDYGEESWKAVVKSHIQNKEGFECYNSATRGEFEQIVDWLKEWGCSRTAGLGSLLPWDESFVIESLSDSTIYMAYYTVAHFLQQGSLNGSEGSSLGIKPEDMTRAAWDYVFLGKEYSAEDIPNISEENLKKMRTEFEYWYPMDMRVSGKDLIRNHLTMSLYNHAAIWDNNLKQAMPKSYFCNGYLNLNNKKMSKSTGNFLTLRQCMQKYGVEATRITIADAGDSLNDANFDGAVANAAIMKLFNLEEWMKKHAISDCTESAPMAFWDRIIENELNIIINKVKAAYDDMKFKEVIKYALNEMLILKENWLIATGSNKPNSQLMNRLIESILIMLNPIVPHFCQHVWETVMLPALRSCGLERKDLLIHQGWPKDFTMAEDSVVLTAQYNYLKSIKSDIRIAHQKSMSGGKKAKKGKAAEVEVAVKSNVVLLIGTSFPEYKKTVLEILTKFQFVEGKLQGDYMSEIKAAFPEKKQNNLAMSFARFVLDDAAIVGAEAAFAIEMPFDEEETLRINQDFLYENMPTVTNMMVFKVDNDEAKALPEVDVAIGNAVPGKPQPHFF